MKNILVAGKNEKVCEAVSELLLELDCNIVALTDGIRMRSINVSSFDLIIVSTPLSDEFGLDLVAEIHEKCKTALIVLAKSDIADEVQKKLKFTGAFVISRPFNKSALLQAIRFAEISMENINLLEQQNEKLVKQLDEIKTVNRAKALLIRYLKLTEEQAHRHIQKQAMNQRKSQREIADEILKTYENGQ